MRLTSFAPSGALSAVKTVKLAFDLFLWILCMISHCLWQIYIRLCSFHFFWHHLTTFTFTHFQYSYQDISRDCVIYSIIWWLLDRVPAWLWEVRRVNEPPKKWYFNFQGQFLSQKKFYRQKLDIIGFSDVWGSNFANLKTNSFTH